MKKLWSFMFIALIICILLAVFVSPFASSHPDGLEKVAEDKGFLEESEGREVWKSSLIPDYAMPGINNERIATGIAGLAGTLIVFALAWGIGKLIAKRSKNGQ